MKLYTLLTVSAAALTLAACGQTDNDAPASDTASQTEPPMEMEMADGEMMDHSDHDMGSSDTGHATGVIKSVGAQGDFLTIDHGPIDGIGMGAMTMGFDIAGDVDLSGFEDGDTVSFMVKKGRDGSYRIAATCDTGAAGDECLAGMMDHSGHE